MGAHNLVPVREQDWRHQCCRLEKDGDIFVHTVGTFGVASAAYWYARAGGALGRLVQYCVADRTPFWLAVLADDMDVEAAGEGYRAALFIVFVVAALVGVPISWGKVRGGFAVEWIGYELLLREFKVGVSANRAAWAVKWCRALRKAGVANTGEVEEGVGRLSFLAGMLDYARPFLAAIYRFLAVEERGVVRPLPAYVLLVLRFLEHSIAGEHHVRCGTRPAPLSSALRVDAHAGDGTVGIGAWLPFVGDDGRVQKEKSAWLSVRLTPQDTPWGFREDGESFRVIASLEAFAVLLGVRFLVPSRSENEPPQRVTALHVMTDNRANGFALSKLHSCRFPLSAVLMELSEELKGRDMVADVNWTPREANMEADALSNFATEGFDERLRVPVSLDTTPWHVLDQAITWGREFEVQVAGMRAPKQSFRSRRKKRAEERLRAKDPW